MKNYQFISLKKAKILEESISWLSNLTPSPEVIHVMTNTEDSEDWNIEKTNLLHELQILNKRRVEILENFIND